MDNGDLLQLQRDFFSVVSQPLNRRLSKDDQRAAQQMMVPGRKLSSVDRLQIYREQYWYRLIDSLHEDFPGVRAVVGTKKFQQLIIRYLRQHPSRSFTLRNLGSGLASFLASDPPCRGNRGQAAVQMAAFEWAQIVAFDGPSFPPVTTDDLAGMHPATAHFSLQPHLSLLALDYPLDDFAIGLRREFRGATESVRILPRLENRADEIALPKAARIYVAVHRVGLDLFYKRLSQGEYYTLVALRSGSSVAEALSLAVRTSKASEEVTAESVQGWFKMWSALGWLTKVAAHQEMEDL